MRNSTIAILLVWATSAILALGQTDAERRLLELRQREAEGAPEVQKELGRLYYLLGQRHLFETKMREVHAAFPEDWEPAYLLGRFAFADRGHKKEALQWFETALVRSAGNKRVLAARGEVLEAEGQLAEARVSFEAALPEIPARAGLARLDCIAGEYLRAEGHARAAGAMRELGDALVGQSKWREAAEAYEVAARNHPHALDALFQLAKTYRRLKQAEKADEALRRWRERSELLGLPVP